MPWRAKAHSAAGIFGIPLKQGTLGLADVASAETMSCCSNLGSLCANGFEVAAAEGPAKIELSVSSGTEFCEFCRRPSNEAKRKVLSFWIGKPMEPPYCWRVSEFLIGCPVEVVSKLAKVGSTARAELKANGSRASMASSRKKP